MPYTDRNITCRKCRKLFLFTAREQEFFAMKNLPDPELCVVYRAMPKPIKAE